MTEKEVRDMKRINMIGYGAVAAIVIGIATCAAVYTPGSEPFPVVVKAPTTIAVGEVAVFDATETGADSYAYSVTPPVPCYLFEDGRKLVFASRTGGIQYVFVIAAAKGGQVSIVEHTVTVTGGDDDPEPVPSSFASRLKQTISAISSPGKAEHLTALADNFRTVASMVAAGAIKEPEDIIAVTHNMNTEDLGAAKVAWAPVSALITAELGARADAGSLTTPAEHAATWREIATILEECK